jgi:ascorbate-specific PTS system EIIC-type component UlaA
LRKALLIGAMLLALTHLLGSVVDKLPYSGVIDGVLTCAIGFAVWVAVVGRAHPDPD